MMAVHDLTCGRHLVVQPHMGSPWVREDTHSCTSFGFVKGSSFSS